MKFTSYPISIHVRVNILNEEKPISTISNGGFQRF